MDEDDPFISLLNVIEALPTKPRDDEPLADYIPGVWPTIGDLRQLCKRLKLTQAQDKAE